MSADVSLVFETENDQENRRIRLADIVETWRRQTAARCILEWVLVVYDPRLRMTHNYTNHLPELWGHVAMKGHAFALYAAFRGRRRPDAVIDAVGRYRVLLARLLELRQPIEIPVSRLLISAAFYAWYVVAAGYGYGLAARGKPAPAYRF